MLSNSELKTVNRRRASPLRTLSLAATALFVSASMAAAQCQGGGGGGGGGSAAGGSAGGAASGTSGLSSLGLSAAGAFRGQQGSSGGVTDVTSLTSSLSSMGNRAAIVGAQMRQAQQAQIDQMAKVRRDVQMAAQQRVQLRTAALEARLAREERLAESAAKAREIRIASRRSNTSTSGLIASTDQPTTSKLASR